MRLNLNAEASPLIQLPLAKSLGASGVRIMAPIYQETNNWIPLNQALQGLDVLHNLAYADPRTGDEHRGVRGADIQTAADRAKLYCGRMLPPAVEIGNEPNKAAFWRGGSPAEFAAYAKAMLDAVLSLEGSTPKAVWLGGLADTPDDLDYARALLPLLSDPRVGLSVHRYAHGSPLDVAVFEARERFKGIVDPSRLLVSETGGRDEEYPVWSSGPDLSPVKARVWTTQGESTALLDTEVVPRGGRAFFEAKGQLPPNLYRVSATLESRIPAVVRIGTHEEESVPVLVGGRKRLSVVVRAQSRGQAARLFSIVTPVQLSCGNPTVEPLDWTEDYYAAQRLACRERDARSIDAYCYALEDGHGGSYGLTRNGKSKAVQTGVAVSQ